MSRQLISKKLLLGSDKILFVSHMAIGDFVYYRPFFIALARQYPHLKIDLWVDEVRRTYCFWRWERLKKYSLYDWLRSSSFFNKIYDKTYSPFVLRKSLFEAKKKNYPIVVSLGTLRSASYAALARAISPDGFVVGAKEGVGLFNFLKKRKYKKLSKSYDLNEIFGHDHITKDFDALFASLFGTRFDYHGYVYDDFIPDDWIMYAKLKLLKWGHGPKDSGGKVVFINAFAKTHKRSWPIKKVMDLIMSLKKVGGFFNAIFIVSCPPGEYKRLSEVFKNADSSRIFLFTANESFFQLPAMIAVSDLVISVETSIMHLAVILKKLVVSLMRLKTPEWRPYGYGSDKIVWCNRRSDFIKDISVSSVVAKFKDLDRCNVS